MPKDPELAKKWKGSKIRAIASSLKNFKGCAVQYAYNADNKIYSVKVNFQGKSHVLTIKVGPNGLDMMLTDPKGNIVEHAYQSGSQVGFTVK